MNKSELVSKAGLTVSKASFSLKKYSPEILVIAGVVGTIASAILACKATTKIDEIVEDKAKKVELVHKYEDDKTLSEPYTEDDAKKDLTIIYIQTGLKFVKLYAPAVLLGVLSLTSILASNNILRKRNVALAAAYTAIDKSFKTYRNRVVDRFGEQVDKELKYGIKAKKIEEKTVDEKGKEKTVKSTVNVADSELLGSPYAVFFDKSNPNWENNSDYSEMFIRAQQQFANDLLSARHHLFLNEVYDIIGEPRTKAGQVVGWIYDEKNPSGDNFVDFGAFRTSRETEDGVEPVIIIDPNVDGNILDKI